MARSAREAAPPIHSRRPELVRPVTERRDFQGRQAKRHLEQRERPWASYAYGVFFAALLVIFSVAYTTYAFSKYRGEILPGVYVDQTPLGGLTPKQATNLITKQLAGISQVPIRLVYRSYPPWEPRQQDIDIIY